jgi:peptidoglycan/LPS O-acetylase OafA/YrhL
VDYQAQRLPALTGLRFIAAAMILAQHARAEFHISVPPIPLDHGVSLFFVLSGFILAHVYPQLETWPATKQFLALRIARIWPAHAVTLLLAVLAYQVAIDERFLANLTMVHAWIPVGPWFFSYNAVSWSVSTEFFFYLMFPLLIWNWSRTFWWKWIASLGVLILLCELSRALSLPNGFKPEKVVTSLGVLYINPLARLLEFITGMVTYLVYARLRPNLLTFGRHSPRLLIIAATIVELGALVLVWYFFTAVPLIAWIEILVGDGVWREWAVHACSFPALALLILILGLGFGWVSKLLSSTVAVILGEISYSVYLLNQIVYSTYVRQWHSAGANYLDVAICVTVTLGLAYLLWRVVELPCRTWVKNRMDTNNRMHTNRSVAAPEMLLPLSSPAVFLLPESRESVRPRSG